MLRMENKNDLNVSSEFPNFWEWIFAELLSYTIIVTRFSFYKESNKEHFRLLMALLEIFYEFFFEIYGITT